MKSRFPNYDEWVKSVLQVYPLLSSEVWVAGGAVRNLVEGFTSPQQDLDLYFSNNDQLLLIEAWLVDQGWGSKYRE